MALYLRLPATAGFNIDNELIVINAFNANDPEQSLRGKEVSIIASGPSIQQMPLSELLDTPVIFVNGSISLIGQHHFSDIVGYVISDARFINHQPEILQQYYTGQPLYATLAVFEAMATAHPDIMRTYHHAMRVLYPVDRPWGVKSNKLSFSKLIFKKKRLNKRMPLSYFINNPNFIIDGNYKAADIGVSLNITHGFVEAGTVAYVAAQLAFSRQVTSIHLYGIDLLNSKQPRFYEHKNNSAPSMLSNVMNERIVPSFNLLGRTYQSHGVPVINHSPISKSLFDTF
jgi:Kdo-III transferase WaaZ